MFLMLLLDGIHGRRRVSSLAHVLAVLALFALGIVRYLDLMLRDTQGGYACEVIYLNAATALVAGHSPYVDYYLYPPTLAIIGAAVVGWVGESEFIVSLRYANLLGGCIAVWMSLHRIPLMLWQRLTLSALLITFWPPLASGIQQGNISPLVSGLTILSLCTWKGRPVAAGLALGAAIALKPTSALALLMLPLFGYRDAEQRRAAFLAVGAACALGLTFALMGAPYLLEMLDSIDPQRAALGNTSIYRVLYLLGLEVPPLLLMLSVSAFGVYLARKLPPDDTLILCSACCLSLLSMPILWVFTLLLALPIQCHAMDLAIRGYRRTRARRELAILLAVVGGGLTIAFSESYGAIEAPLVVIEACFLAVPLVALAGLTWYLVGSPERY